MSGTRHARPNNYNPVLVKYMSQSLGLVGGPEHPISSFLRLPVTPSLSVLLGELCQLHPKLQCHGCGRGSPELLVNAATGI